MKFEIYNKIINHLSENEILKLIDELQNHLHREKINKLLEERNENILGALNESIGKYEERGNLLDIRY